MGNIEKQLIEIAKDVRKLCNEYGFAVSIWVDDTRCNPQFHVMSRKKGDNTDKMIDGHMFVYSYRNKS